MPLGNTLRRLRGAAGNALVWGACWSTAALAMAGLFWIAGAPVTWSGAWRNAARVGAVGGLTSVAFSIAIGLLYRGRRLSEISWVRFGLGGGIVAGLVLPTIMFVGRTISGDGPLPIEKWISSALIAAAFGTVAAGLSLKLAQLGGSAASRLGDSATGRLGDSATWRRGDVAARRVDPQSKNRP